VLAAPGLKRAGELRQASDDMSARRPGPGPRKAAFRYLDQSRAQISKYLLVDLGTVSNDRLPGCCPTHFIISSIGEIFAITNRARF
jgi:hypothetical protein